MSVWFCCYSLCHLSPELSAVGMEIRWFKGTDCVCLYKNRQVTEGRGYEGRVSLITQELERGNVSLHITNCDRSDTGYYLCQVTDGNTTEECTIGVFGPFSNMTEFKGVSSGGEICEGQTVLVSQESRNWTEEERIKMKQSALLTELPAKTKQLEQTKHVITDLEKQLQEKNKHLTESVKTLDELRKSTEKLEENQTKTNERLESVTKELQEKNTQLEESNKLLREKERVLEETEKKVESSKEQLETLGKELQEKERVLEETEKEMESSKEQLETLGKELQDKSSELQEMMILLEQQKTELREKDKQMEEKERLLRERDTLLMGREKQVEEKDRLLEERNKQLQERTDPDPPAPVRRRNSMDWLPPNKEELSGDSKATPSHSEAAEVLSADTNIFIPEETEVTLGDGTTTCYRFQCPHAGQFQCKFTSLVFEMKGKGEVLYRIVSWDTRLLDGLGQMQPAGPLYDIDCNGSISHLHLPHCEILSDESQVQQAVAHFTAGNLEIIPPCRVTTTHVIIRIQGLSLFGLLRNLFKAYPISGQVLLFHKKLSVRQRKSKLHIHLLPRNVPVEEVKKKHLSSKYIDTSSKCQLTPGKKYKPSCDPYMSQPEDETFECDYGPNYHPTFEVFIDIDAEDARIGLLDEDDQEVWRPRLLFLTDINTEGVNLLTDAEQ